MVSQCLIQNGNLKTSGDGMEKEMGALGLSIYITNEVVAKMIDYFSGSVIGKNWSFKFQWGMGSGEKCAFTVPPCLSANVECLLLILLAKWILSKSVILIDSFFL